MKCFSFHYVGLEALFIFSFLFYYKNDFIIYIFQNYLLAATYIEDARFGRTLEYNTDDKSLINYRKYSNIFLRWGTLLILTVLLLLALFEDPAVEGLSLDYWVKLKKIFIDE